MNMMKTALVLSVAMYPVALEARMMVATPIAGATTTIRYHKGTPTLQSDDAYATVNITPLEADHGRMAFAVSAFNKGPASFNLGVESMTARLTDGTSINILTKDDLVHKAKHRAMWAQIGMAVAGGLAAAGAASYAGQHSYDGTVYAPSGTYRYTGTSTNYTEQALATGAVVGASGYAIGSIQNDLDHLVEGLGENVLQTTTVDQGTSYGGMVVIEKVQLSKGATGLVTDRNMLITVNAGGHPYPFLFGLK